MAWSGRASDRRPFAGGESTNALSQTLRPRRCRGCNGLYIRRSTQEDILRGRKKDTPDTAHWCVDHLTDPRKDSHHPQVLEHGSGCIQCAYVREPKHGTKRRICMKKGKLIQRETIYLVNSCSLNGTSTLCLFVVVGDGGGWSHRNPVLCHATADRYLYSIIYATCGARRSACRQENNGGVGICTTAVILFGNSKSENCIVLHGISIVQPT